MVFIVVKVINNKVDLMKKDGLVWFQENIYLDEVVLFMVLKSYFEDKNLDIFQFIQQGVVILKGELFEVFQKVLFNYL